MMTAPVDKMRPVTPQGLVSLLQEKKGGFTYGYFHGPAQTQGLADVSGNEDDDMKGVVKNITYGDLWSKKNAKHEHGMQRRLLTRIRTCNASALCMHTSNHHTLSAACCHPLPPRPCTIFLTFSIAHPSYFFRHPLFSVCSLR